MLPLHTLNLIQLDQDMMPIGYASGCLISYRGRKFVATVAHATNNMGNWAVEIGFDTQKQKIALYQLGQMGFVKKFVLKRDKLKEREVDFSYKLLTEDIFPRRQILNDKGAILEDHEILPIETELTDKPEAGQRYGFWGCTKQRREGKFLKVTPKCTTKLSYVGVGEHNQLYFFKTPKAYKSYEEYKGCSGAPILNEHGELVALVVEGDKKKTGIFGLPIHTIKPLLDVEILQAERDGTGQPASRSESDSEGGDKLQPEAEVRSL